MFLFIMRFFIIIFLRIIICFFVIRTSVTRLSVLWAVTAPGDFVGRALARIEQGDGADTELHNVRAYLVNTLELIERDPGIEAAADDLYATAAAFVADQGPEHGRRDKRVLQEAFLRLREKLAGAAPSEKARGMRLE